MPASTGASHGRAGGRLSVGARASRALKQAPLVRVVAAAPPPPKRQKLTPAAAQPPPPPSPTSQALLTARVTAQAFAAAGGHSPQTSKLLQASALAATAAVLAVQSTQPGAQLLQQPASSTATPLPPASQLSAAPAPSSAAASAAPTRAASPAPSLFGNKRGAAIVVKPKASYAARKTYDFEDVCHVGAQLKSGKLNKRDLDKRDEDGELVHLVPRTTAAMTTTAPASKRAKQGERQHASTSRREQASERASVRA